MISVISMMWTDEDQSGTAEELGKICEHIAKVLEISIHAQQFYSNKNAASSIREVKQGGGGETQKIKAPNVWTPLKKLHECGTSSTIAGRSVATTVRRLDMLAPPTCRMGQQLATSPADVVCS